MHKCNNTLWKHMMKTKMMKKCYVCNTELSKNINFCAGHIQPRVYNGSNELNNLNPLCRTCNGRMYSQHMDEYKRRYDAGHMPSREEYDKLKSTYGGTKIPCSYSFELCDKRLRGFMSAFKCWPRYDDEFDPEEEIKWKNNHVLYLFYNHFLVAERKDYEKYLCSTVYFNYDKYRQDMSNELYLKPDKYEYVQSLSKEYNVPIDMNANRYPWLRKKGGNYSWGEKNKLIIYPFVKKRVMDITDFI